MNKEDLQKQIDEFDNLISELNNKLSVTHYTISDNEDKLKEYERIAYRFQNKVVPHKVLEGDFTVCSLYNNTLLYVDNYLKEYYADIDRELLRFEDQDLILPAGNVNPLYDDEMEAYYKLEREYEKYKGQFDILKVENKELEDLLPKLCEEYRRLSVKRGELQTIVKYIDNDLVNLV